MPAALAQNHPNLVQAGPLLREKQVTTLLPTFLATQSTPPAINRATYEVDGSPLAWRRCRQWRRARPPAARLAGSRHVARTRV
jgi:hypothetical protein